MGLTNNLGKLSNMITSTGSAVGIGQPSPSYTLDVSGTGRFTGALLVSSNLQLGSTTASSTTTPITLNMGGTYGTTLLNGIKIKMYDDGTTFHGLGVIAGNLYLNATDGSTVITLNTNNTERMRITSGGNVGINYTTPYSNVGLTIRGTNTTSGDYTIYCMNSSNNKTFSARNDGYLEFGTLGNSPYNYGASFSIRAAYLDAAGSMGYNGSTRESKINITEINTANWINQLNPVTFNKRKKDNEGNFNDEYYDELHYGFIADEMELVNPNLVYYDEKDGEMKLAGIHYDRLIAPLVKAVQELSKQNEELSNRLNKAGL